MPLSSHVHPLYLYGSTAASSQDRAPDGALCFEDQNLRVEIQGFDDFAFPNPWLFHNPETGIVSGVLGYISNFEGLLSGVKDCRPDYPGIVERLYLVHGRGMAPRLEGVYTCFVYDATLGRLLAFQDEWASNTPLYYAVWGNRLFFSTTLRLLLSRCEIPREFNFAAARRQIFYKVVPTRETLVRGVAKLRPGEMLLYDLATARLRVERVPRVPLALRDRRDSGHRLKRAKLVESGEPLFLSALESHLVSLDGQVSPAHTRNLALSSGHDTNLLLFFLARMHDAIRAFTVGGRLVNEIGSTRKILASYPGCCGASRTVPASIAKSLPDIAWRLEGYVFERGVFLQYALAELLREAGGRCVVLGEGADQIVDPSGTRIVPRLGQRFRDVRRRLSRPQADGGVSGGGPQAGLRRVVPEVQRDGRPAALAREIGKPTASGLARRPYYTQLDFVLKKSGILMNSFGIQGFYPFLNRDLALMGRAFGRLNENKRVTNSWAKTRLGERVAEHVSKIGGFTDTGYIAAEVSEHVPLLLESELARRLLRDEQIEELRRNAPLHSELILHLFYLWIVERLLISRRFDAFLEAPECPVGWREVTAGENDSAREDRVVRPRGAPRARALAGVVQGGSEESAGSRDA